MTRGNKRGRTACATIALVLATGILGATGDGTAHAVPPGPVITAVAGTGVSATPIAPGSAVSSPFEYPYVTAVDPRGNVYVADCGAGVFKVSPTGQLTAVAGNGTYGASVPGPATASPLGCPSGLAIGADGTVYISQYDASFIDKVSPEGMLTIIAGNGTAGQPTEGLATASAIMSPYGLALDAAGDLIVADYSATGRVYKITPAGQLVFIAGNGTQGLPTAGPALQSPIGRPDGVAVDPAGNIYLADYADNVVEKVTPAGRLSVFAGTGVSGAPTPGPATGSKLAYVTGLAADAAGNIYVANAAADSFIVKITPGGVLSVVAGNLPRAAPTYGGPAVSSALNDAENLAAMADGTLIVANCSNYTVDRIGLPTPGPVTVASTASGDATGTVSFGVPQDIGTSAITGYQVSTDGGATWHPAAVTGTDPLTIHLTGLVNGRRYPVQVRAVNTSGPGTASLSATVTPASRLAVAGAPTALTGRPGPTTAVLRWRAPIDPGTPALSGYTVTLADRGTGRVRVLRVGAISSLTATGLTPGEAYSFTVAATNAAGTGPVGTAAFTTSPPPFAVSAAQRRVEIAVPAHPSAYRGALRHTRADGRSHAGIPAFAAGSLHGYQLHAGQAVSLGANLFAYNSGRLSRQGRSAVRALVADLAGVHSVTCEGYSDYQVDPVHGRLLSLQRAHALCEALAADGLRPQRVVIAGYGGQHPVVVGGTIHQRSANRRAILVTN